MRRSAGAVAAALFYLGSLEGKKSVRIPVFLSVSSPGFLNISHMDILWIPMMCGIFLVVVGYILMAFYNMVYPYANGKESLEGCGLVKTGKRCFTPHVIFAGFRKAGEFWTLLNSHQPS